MYVPNIIKTRFSCEVDRIKQLLTNNNFPMAVIDEIICKFLNKKLNPDFERINLNNTHRKEQSVADQHHKVQIKVLIDYIPN